jgi:NADH dehydrogenase FAD-containing subunit
VTLVETLEASPVSDKAAHGYMLHSRLKASECKFYFNTSIKRVDEGAVTLISDGMERVLTPVEQVVVATGLKSRVSLKDTLQEMDIPHIVIGDAVEPRRIIEATEEGAQAAWNL